MNTSSARPRVRIHSAAGLLAAIPHLLGFTPSDSLVVVGRHRRRPSPGRVPLRPARPAGRHYRRGDRRPRAGRPGAAATCRSLWWPGMGPGTWSPRSPTPSAPPHPALAFGCMTCCGWRTAATGPTCAPTRPAARPRVSCSTPPRTRPPGRWPPPVCGCWPSREALAATIAPVTGADADAMRQATAQAERAADLLIARKGPDALIRPGLTAVRAAIRLYRDGGSIVPPIGYAWLALMLRQLRIRDDAWARMDPQHQAAHLRLWTDLVRRAQPGYVAAPAIACWPSPPGRAATARWPTWRSTAPWPISRTTRWRCCCATSSTQAPRRRRRPSR